MLFYKVTAIAHIALSSGGLAAQNLERAINKMARIGWVLDRIVAGETAVFLGMGNKDSFFLIFKKDIEIPEGLHFQLGQNIVPITKYNINGLLEAKQFGVHTLATYKGMNDWIPFSALLPDLSDAIFPK